MKQHMKWWLLLTVLLLALGVCSVAMADDVFEVKDGIAVKLIDTTKTEITADMFDAQGITIIGAGCFKDTEITSIVFSDKITSIQAGAFSGCRKLAGTVTLPSGVKSIPENCFQNCSSLSGIVIPSGSGMTAIGKGAFQNCVSLQAVEGSREVVDKNKVYKPVPGTITSVGDGAFTNCPHVVISCFKGSAVETFAIAGSIEYESIDPVVDKITPAATEYVLVYDKSTPTSISITVTVEPAIAANSSKNWSTSDPSVAEVSQEGVVTPNKSGVVTITIASDKKWKDKAAAQASTKVVVLDSSKGWQQVPAGGPFYYCDSAEGYATGWKEIGGKFYYFDSLGRMQTGWKKIGSGWYYLNEKGIMQTGWQKIEGNTYFFDDNGVRQAGWLLANNEWYYLDPENNCAMVTGTMVIDGKTYYFYNDGVLKQPGWHKDGDNWYYLKDDLTPVKGWLKYNAKWYYLHFSDGHMMTGWVKDAGKWYYLNKDGAMLTGWIKDATTWYFLNSNGAMQTGWQKINKVWYYLGTNGAMVTGWQQIDGVWYYFDPSGAMATGKRTIDGVVYRFSKSGAWIP